MWSVLMLVAIFCSRSLAVIYSINESEYRKMPALFEMDDYGECLRHPEGMYCIASFELYSEGHSDLLHFIREYSAHTLKHFNHTLIHRGVCVTEGYNNYVNASNIKLDLETILEARANDSIWSSYKIEARSTKIDYCRTDEEKISLDASDYVVAAIYVIIILLNIVGTSYDVIWNSKDLATGNPYLLAFSLRRNWKKLVAPAGKGLDGRIERLKLFYGIRATLMVCVISAHAGMTMVTTFMSNPYYLEKAYGDLLTHLISNGTLVTQMFFIMSSFLLAYNLQIIAETKEITWTKIPMAIVLRWVRLTPAYALVIATISTWMRHIGDGPLWPLFVSNESNACRQYWWANIFYFNNYIYSDDKCFPQGWFLAADMQLYVLGITLLVLFQKAYYRKLSLIVLFLASLVITAAHTYFLDLGAVMLLSPESIRSGFVSNDVFNLIYIRAHTNISTCMMGLAGGLLTRHWQNTEKDMSQYKKYRWIIWSTIPLGVALILSGGVFYIDGYAPSPAVRVLYATLHKPLFQIITIVLFLGIIFKLETVYRGVAEWRGFTWAGRVSYCAYLLHAGFQISYVGGLTELIYTSSYSIFTLLCTSIVLSFLCGAALWLCVEAPINAVSRSLLAEKKTT